jgi:hypothetical protein
VVSCGTENKEYDEYKNKKLGKYEQLKKSKLNYEKKLEKINKRLADQKMRSDAYMKNKIVYENRELFSTVNINVFSKINRLLGECIRYIDFKTQKEHDDMHNAMKAAYIKQIIEEDDVEIKGKYPLEAFRMVLKEKTTLRNSNSPMILQLIGVVNHSLLPWTTLAGTKIAFGDAMEHFPESATVAQQITEELIPSDFEIPIIPSEHHILQKPPTVSNITNMQLFYILSRDPLDETFTEFNSIDPVITMLDHCNSTTTTVLSDSQKRLLFDQFNTLLYTHICDCLEHLFSLNPETPWIHYSILKSLWPSKQSVKDVIKLFF